MGGARKGNSGHNRFRLKQNVPHKSGFTIIEVLIVLAIVGIILMIVFMAVPAGQRNTRNHGRKRAIDQIAAELSTYATDHGGRLPASVAEGNQFVDSLPALKNVYTIDFRDLSGAHAYIPPIDTIAIEYGHWCNRHGDGTNTTDPIAGNHSNIHYFVVWTELEPESKNIMYCLDNLGK